MTPTPPESNKLRDWKERVFETLKHHRINGSNVGLSKELEVYHAGVVENIILNIIEQEIELAKNLVEKRVEGGGGR